MRFALLLCLVLAAGAATAGPELLTLTDGRVLTGVYDEAAGTVTLAGGKASVVLPVKPDQIVSRKRVPAPAAPAAGAAAQPVADPSAPPKAMTPEQKAAAVQGMADAQRAAEIAAVEGEGRKAAREAAATRKDAERKRGEWKRLAAAFRERAKAEGEDPSRHLTEGEALTLKHSGATNGKALAAKAEAEALDLKADQLDGVAKTKAAQAAAMAGR